METGLVYCITNLINEKKYIGQTTKFKNRKNEHLYKLENDIHENKHLQNSYNKYGKDNFVFTIINKNIPVEILDDWELYYIEEIYGTYSNKGYNMILSHEALRGENNPFYGKKHSDEVLRRISKKISGENSSSVKYSRNKYLEEYKKLINSDKSYLEFSYSSKFSAPVLRKVVNHVHWTTENMPEFCRLKYKPRNKGENNPASTLTLEECLEIYKRYNKENITQKELGKEYSVHRKLVGRITNHKHWSTRDLKKEEILKE